MSLALFLLASDIATVTQTAAAATQIASSVTTMKNVYSINRARAEAMGAPRAPTQLLIYSYDVDLFLAKIAMLSYIAKSDCLVSPSERTELEQTLAIAEGVYGSEATAKARQIFESEGNSFIALEPYLRRVKNQDLDSFIFYSEEYAKADNDITPNEKIALQKLHSYIDSRKGKKTFTELSCPNCGAAMIPDSYGYKATCEHCGYAIVLNTDNSPQRNNSYSKCTSCGTVFDGPTEINFCRYCGGRVTKIIDPNNLARINNQTPNLSNLYISYASNDIRVGMVTRIVSTGMKNTFTNGQTIAFYLSQGRQTIVLKIGRINYNRAIVIHPSNSPVRIYASYDGRGHISIDQPTY